MEWTYNQDKKRIVIDPPKQRLRITGHRIASVLGMDKWKSEFQSWCEITKLVTAPYQETKYIVAGRVIEPKIIEYVGKHFPNVKSIEEYYGNVFKEYERNNFKDESDRFGGVIDAVSTANDNKTILMLCECKTSSKPQEWANGQVPIAYLLQGALYSYLKGLDEVLFACTFLQDMDYAHPEDFKVTDDNTILVVKRLKDLLFEYNGEYKTIEEIMQIASDWWDKYIETGISPEFDEKVDKEYLSMIRALRPMEDSTLEEMVEECVSLEDKISDLKEQYITELDKKLKILKDNIKTKMIENDLSKVGRVKLSKSTKLKLNEKMLIDKYEKIYNECCEEKEEYRISIEKKKEE